MGDLPSPRMIEVVRPKELVVPQWRVIPSASNAGAADRLADGEDEGDEDEEDDFADEMFERRHMRTLERAITAARAVARELAAQERQKQQAQLSQARVQLAAHPPTLRL